MKLTLVKNVDTITTHIIVWVATTTKGLKMILIHSATTVNIHHTKMLVKTVFGTLKCKGDKKMKMTNGELDIIGQAYQNAYDELVEDLSWIGKSQSDVCTIANTWQWFKVEKLDGCMPNGETFDLLLALAKDIDILDDMAREFPFINEKERLYCLMKQNPKLHKQIDLSAFAIYMENWNGNGIIHTINWLLEKEVKYFNHIIKEINNQTFNYITKEEWMESPYTSFDGLYWVEVRK